MVRAIALLPLVGWVAPASASSRVGRGSDPGHHVYCLSSSPLTIRVTYRYSWWDVGYRRFPIIVNWGDNSSTAMPGRPAPHPYDYSHPYQLDHTYAARFRYGNKVIADNSFDGHLRIILFLKRLLGSCPPPPQTPEVPLAVVLPLTGLAIVGVGTWRRQRRAPDALAS